MGDPSVAELSCCSELELASAKLEARRAYAERNRVVALLARLAYSFGWCSGTAPHEPAGDSAWEHDWRTVVLVDLPTGQVSWHFHDSELGLLDGLPAYPGAWDGHDTGEKYQRVDGAFWPARAPEPRERIEAARARLKGWAAEAAVEQGVSAWRYRQDVDRRVKDLDLRELVALVTASVVAALGVEGQP